MMLLHVVWGMSDKHHNIDWTSEENLRRTLAWEDKTKTCVVYLCIVKYLMGTDACMYDFEPHTFNPQYVQKLAS